MRFNTPPVVKNLLIINIIVFAAQTLLPFGDAMTNMLALHYWGAPDFRLYQLITYMFLHGNVQHLFFNMFALWMFGRLLESEISSRRFLAFYIITGMGAALFNMGVLELEFMGIKESVAAFIADPTPTDFSILAASKLKVINQEAVSPFVTAWMASPDNSQFIAESIEIVKHAMSVQLDSLTVGASGAIFGILLAFGLMHPNDRIMLLIPPIPMKAKYFVMGYAALELIMGFASSGDSIAHFAHIGGMLWGWLLLKYWKNKGYIRY